MKEGTGHESCLPHLSKSLSFPVICFLEIGGEFPECLGVKSMVLGVRILFLSPLPLEPSIFSGNAEGVMRNMVRVSFLGPQEGAVNEPLFLTLPAKSPTNRMGLSRAKRNKNGAEQT